MAQQTINVGIAPNDGLGDPIRTAYIKCNDNFTQLYSRAQTSPPTNFVGVPGDQAGMYAYDENYFYYCFANYDGSSIIWAQISQAGNIVVTTLQSGNSNVTISSANGNVTMGVRGVPNVVTVANIGQFISGIVSATGNITGGNLRTVGQVSATGNITSSGNVSGAYILGNGSQLTGLPALYGNANVSAFLPTYTGNLYPGAVYTDLYLYSNGSPFLSGAYTNANVAAYLPTYTGNLGGTLTTGSQPAITQTGTLTALAVSSLNAVTVNAVGNNISLTTTFGGIITVAPSGVGTMDNMVIGNTTPQSANFTTVSASGNVTGSYILGNASYMTGIPASYGNANVAAYLPTYTGNIAAGNISATSNVNVNGNVSVAGNIYGTLIGQMNGLVNSVNPAYGTWDFGYILANTYSNPIQWIFASTSAGNIDLGTVSAPSALSIDIGTIF
jgi:hypothetical protein